ncbi:MAG: PQQ-like beta-propeller repeat protein [Caldisericia bacterium]|nr:PQQ-like beta-propeller repeat protein [Caldisericia bacterium]
MKLSNTKFFLILLLIILFFFPPSEIVLTLQKTNWICVGGNQERTFYSPIELNFPLSKKWQLWNERIIDFVVSDEYMFVFLSSGVIRRFDVNSGKLIDQRKPISGSFSIAMNHYPIIKEYELKEGIHPSIVPKVRYTLYFIEYETGILYSYSYFQDEIKWICKLKNEKDILPPRYYYFTCKNENLYVVIESNRIIKIDRESGKIFWLTNLGANNESGNFTFLAPSYQYATFYLNEINGRVIFTLSPGYTLLFWIINADNGELTNMFEVGRGEVCGVTSYFQCPSTFCCSEDLKTMYAFVLEKIYEIDLNNSMLPQEILFLPKDLEIYLPSLLIDSYPYITLNENILSILILEGEKSIINGDDPKIHFINIDIENKKLLSHEIFDGIPSVSVKPIFGIKGIEQYKESLIIIERSGVYKLNNESGLEEIHLFKNYPIDTYEQVNPYIRYHNTLYIYHCGEIMSLNLKTMEVNWEISVGTENILENGIYYSDGIIYCKANDDSAILAIDALTGKQIWKTQLRRELSNNILITDQYIIAGNVDQCLPFYLFNNGLETSIWLIDKKNGKIYWEINSKELKKECCNDSDSDSRRKGLLTPPILFDKNIYFFMDDKLYSIPLSSTKNLGSLKVIELSSRDNIFQSCPRLLLADNRKAYYLAGRLIYSIESNYRLSSDRFELPLSAENTITSICLDEEGLFVAAYLERPRAEAMRIYKLGRKFEEIWSVNLCKEIENCPITLMSLSLDDKNVYVNFKGFDKLSNGIICIDKKSGNIKWKKDIEFLDFFKILKERYLYFPLCEYFPFKLEPVSIKNSLIITNQNSKSLSFIDKENGREIYNLSIPYALPTAITSHSFIPIDLIYKDKSTLKGLLYQNSSGNLIFYEEHNN